MSSENEMNYNTPNGDEDYSELVNRGLESIGIPEGLSESIEKGVMRAQLERRENPLKRLGRRIAAVPPMKKAAALGTAAACLVLSFLMVTYAPVFIEAYNARFLASSPTEGTQEQSEPQEAPGDTVTQPSGIAGSAVGDVEITALSEGYGGISPDTRFLVTTKDKTTAELLERSLSVPTGEGFSVEQKDAGGSEFLLSFDNPLEEGSVYNIRYLSAGNRPLSFAFQTQDSFSVTGTVPANGSYQVPVDTGIEITFDRPIASDIAEYVSFTPALTGRWEQAGTTYIFIPEALSEGTYYSVDIRDVKSEDGEELEYNNYSFSFQTAGEQKQAAYLNVYGDADETFLPEDDAFVEVVTTTGLYDNTFDVEVYKLDGRTYSELALTASKNETPALPDGAVPVNTAQLPLEVVNYRGDYSYDVHSYVNLGTKLAEGYYFVRITTSEEGKEYTAVKLLQSSYMSVFAQSLPSGLCAWVNDVRTGKPVPDAEMGVGGVSAKTDSSGVAQLGNPALNAGATLTVTAAGAQPHYAVIYIPQAQDKTFDQKYYSYIYTDRQVYKPTDRIDVFGVIRPRPGQEAISSEDGLTISFGDIYSSPLTTDEFGCFAVSIPVSNYSGYGTVTVSLNGESVMNAWISFSDYDKSAYILELTTDKKVYTPDENVVLSLTASTFDGLAASGVSFTVGNTGYSMTTDSAGSAAVTVPVSVFAPDDRISWPPDSAYISVYTSGVEQRQQGVYTAVNILRRDVMLEDEALDDGGVSLSFNKISRDRLEDALKKGEAWDYGDIRDGSVDRSFTVTVYREYSVKKKTGEYYDYIEKRNIPTYTTTRMAEEYETFSGSTTGGRAVLTDLPVPRRDSEEAENFYAVVSYNDQQGRPVDYYINYSYYRYWYYSNTSTIKSYFITLDDGVYSWNGKGARTGASVPLTVIDRNHRDEPAQGGSVMYFAVTDRVLGTYVSDSPSFEVEFKEEYIPNVLLSGAYFDGKRVYLLNGGQGYSIPFDNSQRGLDIKIEYDKDSYAPGDTVNASVSVADEDGRAVKTALNVSVVDEAALAATPYHSPSLYRNYYKSVNYINSTDTYLSYTQHERGLNEAAEKGGGDGEPEIRKNFEDNPVFATVLTDDDGRAQVSFTLGDSITSWRVTLHAVDGRDYIGQLTDSITASLPFYITAVTNERYLEGDDITACIKSRGNALSGASGSVTYSAQALRDGEVAASAQSSSSGPADINLGRLPEGEYVLRLTGKYGEYSDGMELPFAVVKDGVRLGLSGSYRLDSKGTNTLPALDVSQSPVRLTMVNADIADIIDVLYSDSIPSENRTDGLAARAFINSYMDALREGGQLDGGDYAAQVRGRLPQASPETVPELIYGSGELLYTSRYVSAFPETVSAGNFYWTIMSSLYENAGNIGQKIYNTSGEHIHGAAFLLAAATGQPMLSKLKERVRFLTENRDEYLPDTADDYNQYLAVLFYTAALCRYGDDAAAADFLSRFEPYKAESDYNGEYIRTMELFVNTTLNPSAALEYVRTKEKNKYVSDASELIRFVREYYPADGITSEIEYTLDGTKVTKTLTNFESAGLTISREQFEGLSLACTSGRTAVYIDYIGGRSNLAEGDRKIKIERTITAVSGTEAQVSFTVSMPEGTERGWYHIVDSLPVNLRYSRADTSGARYVYNPEKQRVELYFEYNPGQIVSLSYRARIVSSGGAAAESAFISSGFRNGDIWGESGRTAFKP